MKRRLGLQFIQGCVGCVGRESKVKMGCEAGAGAGVGAVLAVVG
jgi:hypothetical protein